MPRPKREFTRVHMKLPTGGPNTSGAILQHYAESTGLGKTRLLETGFLALVQDRANWVYCPKCQAPVSCTLLPHVDPGADVYCRGCGEWVLITECAHDGRDA